MQDKDFRIGKDQESWRDDHNHITGQCTLITLLQDIKIKTAIYIYIQVNKKIRKFERVYRDCIKRTRDKTRIYCIPHDAPGT